MPEPIASSDISVHQPPYLVGQADSPCGPAIIGAFKRALPSIFEDAMARRDPDGKAGQVLCNGAPVGTEPPDLLLPSLALEMDLRWRAASGQSLGLDLRPSFSVEPPGENRPMPEGVLTLEAVGAPFAIMVTLADHVIQELVVDNNLEIAPLLRRWTPSLEALWLSALEATDAPAPQPAGLPEEAPRQDALMPS